MSRLRKKCIIVSMGMHFLLLLVVVFGVAFATSRVKLPETNILTMRIDVDPLEQAQPRQPVQMRNVQPAPLPQTPRVKPKQPAPRTVKPEPPKQQPVKQPKKPSELARLTTLVWSLGTFARVEETLVGGHKIKFFGPIHLGDELPEDDYYLFVKIDPLDARTTLGL